MLRMEEFRLPKLFMVSGYTVYFWSNENGEPIHVHVSKGEHTPLMRPRYGLRGLADVFWQKTAVKYQIKS